MEFKENDRVRIIEIHKTDAFYNRREELIGKTGTILPDFSGIWEDNGMYYGTIKMDSDTPEDENNRKCFHAVSLEKVEG